MKPSRLPRWATSGAAVTEPTEGEKDTGWIAGFRPPASWTNWIATTAYEWLQYLGGVPSANLVIRNVSPVLRADPVGAGNDNCTLVDVIPGGGLDKFEGGPTDKYDEWWFGTPDTQAPNSSKIWRWRRGLGGSPVGIDPADVSGGTPHSIIYDGTRYLLVVENGQAVAEVSTDGLVFTNAAFLGGGATVKPVATWNGLTGASHRFLVAKRINGVAGTVSVSSDFGVSWDAPVTIDANFWMFGIAYSTTLGLWAAVGIDSGGVAIWTSADGASWARATGPAAANEYRAVTVRPSDGQFVAVGNDAAAPDRGVVSVSSGSGTTFTDQAVVPSVEDFRGVVGVGNRVVATALEIDSESVDQVRVACTYESRQGGASGTWVRAGVLVPALPNQDDFEAETFHPMAASDSELCFVVEGTSGGGSTNKNFVLSELSHPVASST